MPNIAAVLKDEIRRLARKEVKSQVGQTRKLAAAHRREIAGLKRLLDQQSRQIRLLQKRTEQSVVTAEQGESETTRFSARSVKAQRKRLGLSATDYGKLLGVSGITVYSWESGKNRPRKAQLAALVAVRGIGKREALKRLAEMSDPKSKGRRR